MRNSNLPLIQAMKGRRPQPSEPPIHSFEQPRTFEVKHSEIPGLPGRKVGEAISVKINGKIHMQHAGGHAVMHVSSVKPDEKET